MRRGLVLVLVVVALWVGAWFALTGVLRARFEASVAQARAQGWAVAAGTPARAGFPFTVALDVPHVAAAGGTALPGAPRLAASRLVLRVALAHPLTLVMALPEGFTVARPGLAPVAVRAATLAGSSPLFGPPGLTVDATELSARIAGGDDPAIAHLHVLLTPRGPDLGFDLTIAGLALPTGGWALGSRISLLRAVGEASGALAAPPANGVRGVEGWMQDWHDRGGRLSLRDLALDWGPIAATGHGALALDPTLQPDAALALHVEGYGQALDALVHAGDLAPGPALAAKFALGLLARGPGPGIDVSAALHDGQLTVGGVTLGQVPKLSWPSAP